MGYKLTEEQFKSLRSLNNEERIAKIEEYKNLGEIDKHHYLLIKSLVCSIIKGKITLDGAIKDYKLTEKEIKDIKNLLGDTG